jgi:hypothetical protein
MDRFVLAEFDVFFHENFTTGVHLHAESKNRIYCFLRAILEPNFGNWIPEMNQGT